MAAIARCLWMLLLSVLSTPSPLGGKTPPLRGRWHEVPEGEQVARSARRGTGGTKCRMRGEQPLAPSSGAPSFVCSLRSQPPVPRFVTCGDISPRSGENLSPTGGRLQRKPPTLPHRKKAPPLGELSPQVTERARTLSSGQWSVTIHDPPPRTTTILQQYGLPFSALRGTII